MEAKIRAIAPWFGGKRTLAPRIVAELGKHTQYFEPFCGSMAVLFAKPPSQKETVNDLHGDLVNLARCLQNEPTAIKLYERLAATLFSEDLLEQAKFEMSVDMLPLGVVGCHYERAYWFFLASWMGRNGTAGTARIDYQIAVRWTKNGGSPTVRWKNAVESIPWWHKRLLNVVILRRDAFRVIDRFEDVPETAIYADPPYHVTTRGQMNRNGTKNGKSGKYLHEFDPNVDHARLAEILRGYRKARIVVSYYDCEQIRALYPGWTVVDCSMNKQLHAQNGRGARKKLAPEILLINGPSYGGGAC